MPDNIAAIILAAGRSQRMGEFKPLLEIAGKSMLQRVIEVATASLLRPVIVVTGFKSDQLRPILQSTAAIEAYNPAFEQGGMLSSIKVGVQTLANRQHPPRAFLILLGDQPGIKSQTVQALADHWTATRAKVLVPTLNKKHGHPVLFDFSCANEILELKATQTLKDIVDKYGVDLPVDDPGVLVDLDTPADYEKELQRLNQVR